jgi:hypothetical protein
MRNKNIFIERLVCFGNLNLEALHLLGRNSTTYAMSPALFALVILETGFLPRLA